MDFLIIFLAQYLYILVLLGAGLAVVFAKPEVRKMTLLLAIITLPAAYVGGDIAGLLIQNPRPFVDLQIAPLVPHDPSNGFPSNHALLTMSVAAVVFVYNRKVGVTLFMLALAIGLGRVLAYVHSPIDILGSAIIAIGATVGGVQILRILSIRTYNGASHSQS